MTGLLLKGLGLFLLAAVLSAALSYLVPGKLLPLVRGAVWLLPLVFLGIEFWASEASHDLNWSAVWRGVVSAVAQTLLFWPGALAGHYAVTRFLRGDQGGPRGNIAA